MRVSFFHRLEELLPHADDWDCLAAGNPLRSWTWLSTWWRHYGGHEQGPHSRKSLSVACVFDEADTLLGVAPWYFDGSASRGRMLRMLGSGEVCSDYLGVLCQKGREESVTDALAECLTAAARSETGLPRRWDLLELTGVDAQDEVIDRLAAQFSAQGNTVHCQPGPNCWRLELPTCWEGYLAMLSKKRRHRLRQEMREYFDSGRAALRWLEHSRELPSAMELLVDLHQRRRRMMGQPGCFASPRFAAFFREAAPALFRAGKAQFYWLELDGKPAAAEFVLIGDGVHYVYQGGVDPEALDHKPGYLICFAMIQRAIEQGDRALDFLRGDETYKSHLRAEPRPSLTWRVVPDRTAAQMRHHLWLAGNNVKHWIKRGWQAKAAQPEPCLSGNDCC